MNINFMKFKEVLKLPDFRIDYNIFCDREYTKFINENKPEGVQLIGHEQWVTRYGGDYYYNFDILEVGGNSGFYALQIAKFIMNFDKIFLIGFDFYAENGQVHYYGDDAYNQSESKWNYKFLIKHMTSPRGTVEDFKKIKNWGKGIYNLNPKSKLTLFPFAEKVN